MSLNVEGLTRETALLKVKEYFENNPDEVIVSVYTDNLSIFSFVEGNREIKTNNLSDIKKSFLENRHQLTAITVDSLLRIRDGQHRFTAGLELNSNEFRDTPMKLKFIVDRTFSSSLESTIEDIVRMQKCANWKMEDYLNAFVQAYISTGNPKYKCYYDFNTFIKTHKDAVTGIRLDDLAAMSMNVDNGGIQRFINNFNYSAENLIENLRRFYLFKDGKIFVKSNYHRLVTTILALYRQPNFKESRIIKLLNEGKYPEGGNSIAIFKLKVEEWYNYGLREESRIHFGKE